MNRGIVSLLGFILTALGFLSIVLSLVGIQFAFLTWLDSIGRLFGFVIKLIMIIIGILLLHIAQSDFRGEEGTGS